MPRWLRFAADSAVGRFVSHLVRRYFAHNIGHQGAALAYYLLFTIFPFMIFISSLLGILDLDISGIMETLAPILPAAVLDLVETYLLYVSQTSTAPMLWFGLFFTIYFPMRAASCLMSAVRRAYHLPKPKNPVIYNCKVLLYTVCLLLTVALTLALTTMGEYVLNVLNQYVVLPDIYIQRWIDWRFAVLAAVMFAAVGILYAAAQDVRRPARQIVPGVVAALAGWMIVSAAYAFYVENFARYSVIYGAVGTVIILLIWLNLSAVALILGAEINDTLIAMSAENRARKRKNQSGEEAAAPR
ncbi:MAG: YihY/virulence factor BrkB family protein [Oscillospiraceae bacterium]|nr:YihY/virulence factor BrkB family protein [Oscillospiraceae bacterium]